MSQADLLSVLVPFTAMLGIAALLLWLYSVVRKARPAARSMRRSLRRTRSLPLWLRLLLPWSGAIVRVVGPRLPLTLRQGVQWMLRRAGLDEDLLPQQFVVVAAFLPASAAVLLGMAGVSGVAHWLAALLIAALPWLWLRDAGRRRCDEIVRDLPLYVDMLTLALEAGGALSVALRVATERSPDSVLRRAFQRVQGDLRAGRTRAEALRALGERLDVPSVTPLIAALIQADASGGSLAAVLRAQSEQRLNERFSRAEKLAMEAPVKMLAPLVLCIFPCTFLVLGFPILIRFLASG
jgi:tight adherence protein C